MCFASGREKGSFPIFFFRFLNLLIHGLFFFCWFAFEGLSGASVWNVEGEGKSCSWVIYCLKEKNKINEAKQSQLSTGPALSPPASGVGSCCRFSLLGNEHWGSYWNQIYKSCYVHGVVLNIFGNQWSSALCQLERFFVALSRVGSQLTRKRTAWEVAW